MSISIHVNFYHEQSAVTLIQRMQHSKNRLCAETIAALLQTDRSWNALLTATACSVNALIFVNIGAEKNMQRKRTANGVCVNQASHASNSTSTVNTPDAGQQMLHVK